MFVDSMFPTLKLNSEVHTSVKLGHSSRSKKRMVIEKMCVVAMIQIGIRKGVSLDYSY